MIRIGKLSRILLAVAFVFGSTRAHAAYTVTIGSPGAGSTWQAGNNSNMACTGSIAWEINTPNPDMRPTTGIVYLHAGGNGGVVTNSVMMTIANVQPSSEDWSASLTLIPLSPPEYGGNGNSGVYTVEADAQVAGVAVKITYVQVKMVNG